MRPDVSPETSTELVKELAAVAWAHMTHAYGAASDVAGQLYAVTVGTDAVRNEAWWELWGNVHHQGTVYSATVHAVPFFHAIARDADHSDRVQALAFLRAAAVGNGPSSAEVRQAVRVVAAALVPTWHREPALHGRALLWLASAFPEMPLSVAGLVDQLPSALEPAWAQTVDEHRLRAAGDDEDLERRYNDDEVMDRRDALEAWALAGWVEASAP